MSTGKLSKSEVQRWIRGQKAAEEITQKERDSGLLDLTPEERLEIDLALKAARCAGAEEAH